MRLIGALGQINGNRKVFLLLPLVFLFTGCGVIGGNPNSSQVEISREQTIRRGCATKTASRKLRGWRKRHFKVGHEGWLSRRPRRSWVGCISNMQVQPRIPKKPDGTRQELSVGNAMRARDLGVTVLFMDKGVGPGLRGALKWLRSRGKKKTTLTGQMYLGTNVWRAEILGVPKDDVMGVHVVSNLAAGNSAFGVPELAAKRR